MKKIIMFAVVGLLAAASAFAADGVGTLDGTYSKGSADGSWVVTATNVGAGVTFTTRLSANVMAGYDADTTNGTFYTLGTGHTSGNKTYASGSLESRIYMREMAVAGVPDAIPAASGTAVTWDNWTAVK